MPFFFVFFNDGDGVLGLFGRFRRFGPVGLFRTCPTCPTCLNGPTRPTSQPPSTVVHFGSRQLFIYISCGFQHILLYLHTTST